MKKTKSATVTYAAVIGAVYIVLTYLSSVFGLSSGFVQLRLSEVLCVLPCFTWAAVPGLFVGCFGANLLTGALVPDVIFGSLATLIGAVGARLVSKKSKNPILISLPTVISNTVIVPLVLKYAYEVDVGLWIMVLGVFVGEVVSATLLGSVFYKAFGKIFHK